MTKLENIITKKLEKAGRPVVKTGDHFIMTTCLNPAHKDRKPSLSINTESGIGKCFSCGYTVNVDYWVTGAIDEEALAELERDIKYSELLKKFEREDLATTTALYLPPKGRDLEEGWRGLTKETINTLGLFVCERGAYSNRVIFPMYDKDGKLVAFNTRALGDEVPKYKYSKGIPVNELVYPSKEARPKGKSYIVLVEGIMDAISMNQDGIPAIFNFGVNYTMGPKKISQLIREGVETIYLAFDKDKAGLEGMARYLQSDLSEYFEVKLAKELPELNQFDKSGCKDYNEYVQTKEVNNV